MGEFLDPEHQDSEPIRKWLNAGGKLVYSTGGGFSNEIGNSSIYKEKLTEYSRSGRAHLIPNNYFANDEKDLKNLDIRSDDPMCWHWRGLRERAFFIQMIGILSKTLRTVIIKRTKRQGIQNCKKLKSPDEIDLH